MPKRMTALFSGRVQGVGFRFTARGIARRFSVTGYVRNLSDGKVELVAEGNESEITKFLEAICRSDLSSYIRNVQTDWREATGEFTEFNLRL